MGDSRSVFSIPQIQLDAYGHQQETVGHMEIVDCVINTQEGGPGKKEVDASEQHQQACNNAADPGEPV